MIIKYLFATRTDGVNLYRSYSNLGMMIRQDQTGVEYAEAVDVENSEYTYTETDIPADSLIPPAPPDYESVLPSQTALDIILGEEG